MVYVLGNRVQDTFATLGKQEESKNVEILEENHGPESTVSDRASSGQVVGNPETVQKRGCGR